MSLRTLFRRSAVPVVAAVAFGALAAVPAEAAVGTPSKPTVSQASTSSPGIKVSWKTVAKATGYSIQWSTSSSFKSPKSGSAGKTTSYVVAGLTPSKKYYFRLRAKAGSTLGKWSSAVSKTRQSNTLRGVPTGYGVKADGSDLVVSWTRPKSDNTDTPIAYVVNVADYRQVDTKVLTDPKDGRSRYYRTAKATTKDSAVRVRIKGAPAVTANGFGRAVYVQVKSQNSNKSWKDDGGKASTRKAFGVVPSSPSDADGIVASPGCSNIVVRWKGSTPKNATGIEARLYSDTDVLLKTVRGYAVAESVNIPGLETGTDYKVSARAINADKSSTGWSNVVATATVASCSGPVKVGTYNLVNNNVTGVPSWSSRKARVAQNIINSGAAVVGVQETRYGDPSVPGDDQLQQLRDQLGADWKAELDVTTGKSFRAGVHLVYNSTVVDPVGTAKGVNAAGQTFKEYAVAQAFTLKSSGEPFVVATLHTDSTLAKQGYTNAQMETYWANQAKAASDLAAVVASNAGFSSDVATVIVGDLNLQRSEWRDTPIRKKLGASLTDARYWNAPAKLTTTNSQNGFNKCGHEDEVGINVDGVFSRGTVSATGWKMVIPGTGSLSGGCYSEVPPSDHNMLVGTFTFGS